MLLAGVLGPRVSFLAAAGRGCVPLFLFPRCLETFPKGAAWRFLLRVFASLPCRRVIMEPRTLALRNGVDLPRVGLGTFRSSAAEVVSAVHAALGCGLRHIDTASIYKNQEAIGKALKTSSVPREQVHGATAGAICRATPLRMAAQRSDPLHPCMAGVRHFQDLAL